MSKYYAVRKGNCIDIFRTWEECKASVSGYKFAEYKSFPTLILAKEYMNNINNNKDTSNNNIKDNNKSNKDTSNNKDNNKDNKSNNSKDTSNKDKNNNKNNKNKNKDISNKITYHLWTDGSAFLHKKAGYAYLILDNEDTLLTEDYGCLDEGPFTAPHAELRAVINGLNEISDSYPDCEEIRIYSDSLYVVNSLTIWGDKRSKNDWKSKEYYELLYPLYHWMKENNCHIEHVSAHSGLKWNERVDKLAKLGANS